MVLGSSINTLHQLKNLLSQINDQDYGKPLSIFSGSSIGQHCRHIIEFYFCLLNNLDSKSINYDARERDLALETSPNYAINAVEKTIELLFQFSDLHTEIELIVEQDSYSFEKISSNFHRELHYLLEHTVHHFALIKIGILSENFNINLPTNFGVAPSTIKYKAQSQQV